MNPFSIHADSLKALQAEQGDDCPVLIYDGESIPILPGGAKFKRENAIGGFALDSDLQLTCLAADFGDIPPQAGETINYQSNDYTIESVTTAPTGLQLRLNCNLNVGGM
jgi:hypothetical protein